MTKPYRCIVHIGLHKTGTGSIQYFLKQNRDELREHGIHFYAGQHIDQNHVELHASTMRQNRNSTFKMKSKLLFDESYMRQTSERVRDFLLTVGQGISLFSAEGLSLLFYKDETDRLAAMLPAQTKIIVYLREPGEYLQSHRNQLERTRMAGILNDISDGSIGSDLWLTNYEERLKSFRATFGPENVTVVSYEKACTADGTVIPSFLREIDLEGQFGNDEYSDIWRNRS